MYLAGGTLLQTYKEVSDHFPISFVDSVFTLTAYAQMQLLNRPHLNSRYNNSFLGIVLFNVLEHTHWQGSLTKLAGNPVCDSSVCVSPFPDITVSRATEQRL